MKFLMYNKFWTLEMQTHKTPLDISSQSLFFPQYFKKTKASLENKIHMLI